MNYGLEELILNSRSHLNSDAINLSNDFYEINDDLQLMIRRQSVHKEYTEINFFVDNWFLFVKPQESSPVHIKHHGEWLKLEKYTAVFAPRGHQILEWKVPVGELFWYGFRSERNSTSLPTNVTLFDWNPAWRVYQVEDLLAIFENLPDSKPISHRIDSTMMAQEAKTLIDQNFQSDFKISDISERLRVSPSVLTHAFKKSFGLSPIEYRNRLRIFYSLRFLMIDKKDLTTSCFESGFADYSRYARNFKKFIGTSPSAFTP